MKEGTITAILVAGGKGQRMGSTTPKQFLHLGDKCMALHSLHALQQVKAIKQIVVVVASCYRHLFADHDVDFAEPGERRQDSVGSGLKSAKGSTILVHDAARPFISVSKIKQVLSLCKSDCASVLALPIKPTIKQVNPKTLIIEKTLEREQLYEMQTPQVLPKAVYEKGLEEADRQGLTITDDVQAAELVGYRVQVVLGEERNFKITTPQDLKIARQLV